MVLCMPEIEHNNGHNKHLRDLLRAARERIGLTQQQVADRISDRLNLERRLTGGAVSEWERFTRHPAIDVMTAWAEAVGLRLVIELDGASGDRISVLVRPESADLPSQIGLLTPADRALVQNVLARFKQRIT